MASLLINLDEVLWEFEPSIPGINENIFKTQISVYIFLSLNYSTLKNFMCS